MLKLEGFFQFQCQNGQLKIYSKKLLINFIGLYRFTPIQTHLNHSILNNEIIVKKSFILRAMKVEKINKVIF